MAYPTVADVRQYLPQIKDSTPELTALTAVLPRAIAIVERAIGQLLAVEGFTFNPTTPAATTKIVTGYGRVELPPIQGDVVSVEYASGFNQWTTIPTTEWMVEDGALLLMYFPADPLKYRVTAPFGYGACPDDVAEIMLQVCVSIWRSKDTGGMISQVGESGSSYLKTVASLNPQQKAVLQTWADQYRVIPV